MRSWSWVMRWVGSRMMVFLGVVREGIEVRFWMRVILRLRGCPVVDGVGPGRVAVRPLAVSAAAVAVGAFGPGKCSLDRMFGLDHGLKGARGAVLVAAVGVAGSAMQLAAFWRPRTPASD